MQSREKSLIPIPEFSDKTIAYLEILSGRTDFPCRPIQEDRFLIGAGSTCQLQMGGNMPVVHTVISREGNDLRCVAMTDSPPLFVNGCVIQSATLKHGDRLEIGTFAFSIHRPETLPSQSTNDSAHTLLEEASIQEELQIDQLSASDLVDLIEKEQEMIEQFTETNSQQGIAALMNAVNQYVPEIKEELEPTFLKEELTELALQLENQAHSLQEREQLCEEGMKALLQSQEQLAKQLEESLSHLEQMKQANSNETHPTQRIA